LAVFSCIGFGGGDVQDSVAGVWFMFIVDIMIERICVQNGVIAYQRCNWCSHGSEVLTLLVTDDAITVESSLLRHVSDGERKINISKSI
jgi:hypothetical protein